MLAYCPKISIVTPSYNQGRFLEQTITSVIEQNYPNLEYIIIDGGSNDNSVDIIKKYEKFITYWVSEPDNGQSDAINKGLLKCTGEIFNWLNSDDYLEPNSLFKIAKAFQDNNANCIYAKTRFFDTNGYKPILGKTFIGTNLIESLCFAHIEQPSTFFKLRFFKENNGVSNELHFTMDKAFWLSFLIASNGDGIHFIDEIIVNFRHHTASKTKSKNDLFERDYAKVMLFFTEHFQLSELQQILKLKYNDICSIQFNLIKTIEKNVAERIVVSFLIKYCQYIYTKNDWLCSKKLIKLLKQHQIKLFDKEIGWLKKYNKQSNYLSWSLFRAKRKLSSVFKKNK